MFLFMLSQIKSMADQLIKHHSKSINKMYFHTKFQQKTTLLNTKIK